MKVAVASFAHQRAATYAARLSDMPGVELIIADPDAAPEDRLGGRAVARRLAVPYLHSWDDLFAAGPEAVVVTSGIAERRGLVERAAAVGARVLCEQPVAATEADAQAMADACAQAGVRLTLVSPACFSPAFAAVRRAVVDDGVIGTLTTLYGACDGSGLPGDPEPPLGGALRTNAPYLLDLVDATGGGAPAEQVYAQANGILGGQPGAESAALVTVRYPGGIVVSIDCSQGVPGDRSEVRGPGMTFVGDRGSLEFAARPRLLDGFDTATGRRWEAGGADLGFAVL